MITDLEGGDPGLAPVRRGQVIAMVSGKDGTGKSTVAANLAAHMARDFSRSVALLDLDLQTGDQALMFRLPTYPCIEDVLEGFDLLTPGTLVESMHKAHALSILTAPPTPERADIFRSSHVREIVSLLACSFDFVVVDVASHLGDVTLEAIDIADRVVLLTTARLPSLKDTKRLLRVLGDIGKDSARIAVVVNDTSRVRMSRETVANSINFPVSAELPHASDALLDAVIDAVPLVLSSPRSDFSRAIAQLADVVIAADGSPPPVNGSRWKHARQRHSEPTAGSVSASSG